MPSRSFPERRFSSAKSLFSLPASQSQPERRRRASSRAEVRVLRVPRADVADSLDVAVAADADVVDALPALVST